MSGLLVVLPVLTEHPTDTCIASITAPDNAFEVDPADVLIIDNSRAGFCAERYPGFAVHRDPDGHNLGVARSWNVGARRVLEEGRDYLVLMSAAMQFGPVLHTTWRRQMETFWGAKVIEADGHSWHLIALHRSCFEAVGLFDPNFHPGYFEAIDWCYRLRMIGWEQGWIRVWVNALSQGVAMHAASLACPAGPLLAYYAEKWGGPKGEETFVQPYGSKPLGYFEEVPVPALAERYGLGEYGVGWW